jgi:nitrogen fixation protein FixH
MKKSILPYIIVVVFVSFASFIGYFVYRSTSHRIDLVSQNYYQNELRFQEQIDQEKNGNLLGDEFQIEHKNKSLTLTLPEGKEATGTVVFMRPADKLLDFSLPINNKENHQQHINLSELKTGLWKVKVYFEVAGKKYYKEKMFTL